MAQFGRRKNDFSAAGRNASGKRMFGSVEECDDPLCSTSAPTSGVTSDQPKSLSEKIRIAKKENKEKAHRTVSDHTGSEFSDLANIAEVGRANKPDNAYVQPSKNSPEVVRKFADPLSVEAKQARRKRILDEITRRRNVERKTQADAAELRANPNFVPEPIDPDNYARRRSIKMLNGGLADRDGHVVYEMDHLATFTIGPNDGPLFPEEGIKKLRKMEERTGVWTMRCELIVERKAVVVVDKQTGDEIERFPLSLVNDPSSLMNNDRRDIYNNVVLFTVVEDPKKRDFIFGSSAAPGASEMHLFQCLSRPLVVKAPLRQAQEVVDEIRQAKAGRSRLYENRSSHEMPPQYSPGFRSQNRARRNSEETAASTGLHIDFFTQVLNSCFEDIERFVARLQQAAEAFKELETRRRMRGARGGGGANQRGGGGGIEKRHSSSASRHLGDGMLNMRARPPPQHEFVDVFQKFKLSFNLLARLRAHIHDPNASELVHFLFSPLSLIVEASRDPRSALPDIASRTVSPLLTRPAKELLLHCLTSRETDLWVTLGKTWTDSADQWPSEIAPYAPRFATGFQPSPFLLGELVGHAASTTSGSPGVLDFTKKPPAFMSESLGQSSRDSGHRQHLDQAATTQPRVIPVPNGYPPQIGPTSSAAASTKAGGLFASEQQRYLYELREKGCQRICQVLNPRKGSNDKELSIERGEILEILDWSRNWWNCRNRLGHTGYVPYSLLQDVTTGPDPFEEGRSESGNETPPIYTQPKRPQNGATATPTSAAAPKAVTAVARALERYDAVSVDSLGDTSPRGGGGGGTPRHSVAMQPTDFARAGYPPLADGVGRNGRADYAERSSPRPRSSPRRSPLYTDVVVKSAPPRSTGGVYRPELKEHSPSRHNRPQYRHASKYHGDYEPVNYRRVDDHSSSYRVRELGETGEPRGVSRAIDSDASADSAYATAAVSGVPRYSGAVAALKSPPGSPILDRFGNRQSVGHIVYTHGHSRQSSYDAPALAARPPNEPNDSTTSAIKRRISARRPSELIIGRHSTPRDVHAWMVYRGFSHRALNEYGGLTGAAILSLPRYQIERQLPSTEAARLDSELNIVRQRIKFERQSDVELKNVLQKRRVSQEERAAASGVGRMAISRAGGGGAHRLSESSSDDAPAQRGSAAHRRYDERSEQIRSAVLNRQRYGMYESSAVR